MLGIIVYFFICLYALRLETLIDFWILAILVGPSQDGLQALSRSYFGRLVPKNDSSEFLGFYKYPWEVFRNSRSLYCWNRYSINW